MILSQSLKLKRKSCLKIKHFVIKNSNTYSPIYMILGKGHKDTNTQKSSATVSRFRVQRFKIHVKSDPFIREHRDLPRRCHVTEGGKTLENNLNNRSDFSNWLRVISHRRTQAHTDNLFEEQ
jgi:hypothetical protein